MFQDAIFIKQQSSMELCDEINASWERVYTRFLDIMGLERKKVSIQITSETMHHNWKYHYELGELNLIMISANENDITYP